MQEKTGLILSNALPRLRPESAGGAVVFEAIYPEQKPRWQYVAWRSPTAIVTPDAGTPGDGEAPLALLAMPHGPRSGGKATAAAAIWVVLANAVAGKDAEFNEWYDSRHLHDVLDLPGAISGQRYTLAPIGRGGSLPWNYLAIFTVERGRVADAFAELALRKGTERMPNPGYLAPNPLLTAYQPLA